MTREEFDDLLLFLDEAVDRSSCCDDKYIFENLEINNISYKIVRDKNIKDLDNIDEWGCEFEQQQEISTIICIDDEYYIEIMWFEPIEEIDNCIVQEVRPYEVKYIDYEYIE